MSVIEDRMYYGLKKVISDNTNLTAFSEFDTVRGAEYVYIENTSIESILPGAGSSTFVGEFNIDYITNNKNKRTVRSNESKLLECLAYNTEYQTSTTHYYFNGVVVDIEHGEDDDQFEFRVFYQLTHTKVS